MCSCEFFVLISAWALMYTKKIEYESQTVRAVYTKQCGSQVFKELGSITIAGISSTIGKTDQLFRNSPSKPSNGQPSEGLLQTFFILMAITTSCLDLKFSDCPMLYPKVSN